MTVEVGLPEAEEAFEPREDEVVVSGERPTIKHDKTSVQSIAKATPQANTAPATAAASSLRPSMDVQWVLTEVYDKFVCTLYAHSPFIDPWEKN